MNNKPIFPVVVLLILALMVGVAAASPIGHWKKGTATTKAWTQKYDYIRIDNVKYTIVEGAKIVKVIERNGATQKRTTTKKRIKAGDTLLFKAEGNRIYMIERIL